MQRFYPMTKRDFILQRIFTIGYVLCILLVTCWLVCVLSWFLRAYLQIEVSSFYNFSFWFFLGQLLSAPLFAILAIAHIIVQIRLKPKHKKHFYFLPIFMYFVLWGLYFLPPINQLSNELLNFVID